MNDRDDSATASATGAVVTVLVENTITAAHIHTS